MAILAEGPRPVRTRRSDRRPVGGSPCRRGPPVRVAVGPRWRCPWAAPKRLAMYQQVLSCPLGVGRILPVHLVETSERATEMRKIELTFRVMVGEVARFRPVGPRVDGGEGLVRERVDVGSRPRSSGGTGCEPQHVGHDGHEADCEWSTCQGHHLRALSIRGCTPPDESKREARSCDHGSGDGRAQRDGIGRRGVSRESYARITTGSSRIYTAVDRGAPSSGAASIGADRTCAPGWEPATCDGQGRGGYFTSRSRPLRTS